MGKLAAIACVLSLCLALSSSSEDAGLCDSLSVVRSEQVNLEMGTFRAKEMGPFTCDECRTMVDALQTECHVGNKNNSVDINFPQRCFSLGIPVTVDASTLPAKCDNFLQFVKELYCPLDPCDQVTTEKKVAPDAICHLLKCQEGMEEQEKPQMETRVPQSCPTYIARIAKACQESRVSKATHSPGKAIRGKKLKARAEMEACFGYTPIFEREGCLMVRNAMGQFEAPYDLCSSLVCSQSSVDYASYCAMNLNMSAVDPVPEPSYLAWLQGVPFDASPKCDPASIQGWGMSFTRASYGGSCFVNGTNNILASLRERCEGSLECTFGNLDLPGHRSSWTGSLKMNATSDCDPHFDIEYRCHPSKGEVTTIRHSSKARFQAVPFGCVSQLSKAQYQRYLDTKRHLEEVEKRSA